MQVNGLNIRDFKASRNGEADPRAALQAQIEASNDFSFLSTELIRSDHFGSFYLPYAGFVAAVHHHLHNRFGQYPALGKLHRSLAEKDLLFIVGKKISLLAVSEESHRHLPTRHKLDWHEFVVISEEEFLTHCPQQELPFRLTHPELSGRLDQSWHFVNATVFVIPSIFGAARGSDEVTAVSASLAFLVAELIAAEKDRIERASVASAVPIPDEIRSSLERFRQDYSPPHANRVCDDAAK